MDSTWVLRGSVCPKIKWKVWVKYDVTRCHLFQIVGVHHRIMASRSTSYFHYSWFNDFETQTPNHWTNIGFKHQKTSQEEVSNSNKKTYPMLCQWHTMIYIIILCVSWVWTTSMSNWVMKPLALQHGPSGPHTFLTDFGFVCDVPRFNGVQSVHCLLSESSMDQTIAETCTCLFPLYKQQGDKENRIDNNIVHLWKWDLIYNLTSLHGGIWWLVLTPSPGFGNTDIPITVTYRLDKPKPTRSRHRDPFTMAAIMGTCKHTIKKLVIKTLVLHICVFTCVYCIDYIIWMPCLLC